MTALKNYYEIYSMCSLDLNHPNNHYMQNQAAMLSKKDKEIDILTKQNKHLRQQIEELNKQLEVAYASLYKNTD